MPTPHIEAPDGAFAPTVLMPGDPKRATRIAEHFLDDAELVTAVRGATGYTGTFEGTPISVMPSGMGIPSAAIYVTELARFYGVRNIIRVGTCGVYQPDVGLRQVVAADRAVTNSSLPTNLGCTEPLLASPTLLDTARSVAEENEIDLLTGTIFSSDIFYEPDDSWREAHADAGVIGVEMEAAGMYCLGALEGFEALAIMTTTDHLVHGEHLSSDERQTTVDEMLELGLRIGVAAS